MIMVKYILVIICMCLLFKYKFFECVNLKYLIMLDRFGLIYVNFKVYIVNYKCLWCNWLKKEILGNY